MRRRGHRVEKLGRLPRLHLLLGIPCALEADNRAAQIGVERGHQVVSRQSAALVIKTGYKRKPPDKEQRTKSYRELRTKRLETEGQQINLN